MIFSNRVVFICPAMPNVLPYLQTYWDVLVENNVQYDIICWNRSGDKYPYLSNYYVYEHKTNDNYDPFRKVLDIWRFARFVKQHLCRIKYKGVFVFTIADSVFLSRTLRKRYCNRYVFDIRDYSPVVKLPIFRNSLYQLLQNSALNVISSKGFLTWLPGISNYVIAHNCLYESIMNIDRETPPLYSNPLNVLTIGKIRDEKANASLIDQLGNKKGIFLLFVGKGPSTPVLEAYAINKQIRNISFYGWYDKREEADFVRNAHMINVCMEDNLLSKYLLSNRLYLAVCYQRPLISYDDCYQAQIINQYKIGLVLRREDDIKSKIDEYWRTFNKDEYVRGCKKFLQVVRTEMCQFDSRIKKVIDGLILPVLE